jgi:hypothetical protein
MIMWRSRLFTALLFFAAMEIHELSTADLPNSSVGMLMFHGSAALVDLILLYAVPALTKDRLCDDMQALCLASIVVNFVGWILYMAYAPPIFYNVLSWSLAYAQWLRLFMVDSNDAHHLGFHLVRGADHGRAQFYTRKEAP